MVGIRRHGLVRRLVAAGLEPRRLSAWGFPFHTVYRSAVRLASRWALPRLDSATGAPGGHPHSISDALGRAYRAFGWALHPLFYLNLSHLGEQWVVLARKPVTAAPSPAREPPAL